MAAHQALLSLGFSRQEHWSGGFTVWMVMGEGGSLSLQGVDQAGLASAMVGGLPSPMPAPEMTLARNRLPCHGPG